MKSPPIAIPSCSYFVIAGLIGLSPSPGTAQVLQDTSASVRDEHSASTDTAEVVIEAQRGSAVLGIAPLAVMDSHYLAATGASSMSELLRVILPIARSADGGDPIFLLNGQRTSGWEEISALPPEALKGSEILPESEAVRFGYPPTRRLVNFITKPRFRAVTLTGNMGIAERGGLGAEGANASIVRIAGGRRLTVAVDFDHIDALRADRRNAALDPDNLFDVAGNVISTNGGELDARLSERAGRKVTSVAVPADRAARYDISGYDGTPGKLNVFDVRPFRTLTEGSTTAKVNAVLKTPLFALADGTFTLSGERGERWSLQGLPAVSVAIPKTNPLTPFGNDAILDRFVGARPMRQRTASTSLHAGAAIRGNLGGWQWDLNSTLDSRLDRHHDDLGYATAAIQTAVDRGSDPFSDLGAATGERIVQRYSVLNRAADLRLIARRTLLTLPSGDLSLVTDLGVNWHTLQSRTYASTKPDSHLAELKSEAGVALRIPITSRQNGAPKALGDLSVDLSGHLRAVSRYDFLRDLTLGLSWSPKTGLQLSATRIDTKNPPDLALRTRLAWQAENVPYYNFSTGRTDYVTVVNGGNDSLAAQHKIETTYGFSWKPSTKSIITLSGSYMVISARNSALLVSALTLRNEAEFPDQFIRDGVGRLVTVNLRPVNADRQQVRLLKFVISANGTFGRTVPAGGAMPAKEMGFFYGGIAPLFRIEDRMTLHPGAPSRDLLTGDTVDGSRDHYRVGIWSWAGASRFGTGVGVDAQYLGAATILEGATQTELNSRSQFTINANAFTWVSRLTRAPWAKDLKLTFQINNLLDTYPRIIDGTGATPYRYQRYFMEPAGRAFRLTLYKLIR